MGITFRVISCYNQNSNIQIKQGNQQKGGFMAMNIFINYIGFEPSVEDKQFLNQKLDQIKDLSPSQATITLDFIKESGRILGVQKIFFGEKPFSAIAENTDVRNLMLELSRKIQDQLITWKKSRFLVDAAI